MNKNPLPTLTYDWLTDPSVFNIGQEPPSSFRHEKLNYDYLLSLNGEWDFLWTENKKNFPKGFENVPWYKNYIYHIVVLVIVIAYILIWHW